MDTRRQGGIAEQLAVDYLTSQNYRILEQNFYCRYGELDIVAEFANSLVFIEVKSLRESNASELYATITSAKMAKLEKSIEVWLSQHRYLGKPFRLDFIGIILDSQNQLIKLDHIKHVGKF